MVKKSMNIKKFFTKLGPGIITGAADDDPSGIATYSQTGAQFGYGMLWMALFMLPLQTAIQEACARIGAITGKGIAAVLKENYHKSILYFVVFLVLMANIINIGADIGAMVEATRLIFTINSVFLTFLFTTIILLLEIFISYKMYANILKWFCLFLIAYPITMLLITVPWSTVLKATFIPHIEFNFQFLFIVTGVLGTTISPYLFFWEASEEVEEEKSRLLNGTFISDLQFIKNLRIDNFIGMLISEIVTWTIIVVTATVLNANGVTDIKTAASAAAALQPLVNTFPNSGLAAKVIFSTGIIGLGFLAIPVLAGSAAYAFGEACNWKVGLDLKFNQGHGFYGVIIVATVIGLLINFIGIDPIKALVYAAVINGVVAVPLIFIIACVASNNKIMGKYRSGILSRIFVWITFICMSIAATAMIFSI